MLTECHSGTYGQDCTEICGACVDKKPCHYVNGTCMNGCERGYQGMQCKTGPMKSTILEKNVKIDIKTESHFFLAVKIGKRNLRFFFILYLLSMFFFKISDLLRIRYTRYVILSVQAFNSGSPNSSDIVPNRIYLPYTHCKWMHFC